MAEELNIMCFTWNAAGLRICETLNESAAKSNRTGFFATITGKKGCRVASFFEPIRATISESKPSIVVFTTQEEDSDSTYFHSDLIPNQMKDIQYSLLKRSKADKVGEVPSGTPYKDVSTGPPSGGALRISIFVRDTDLPQFSQGEKDLAKAIGNDGQVSGIYRRDLGTVAGVLGAYIKHQKLGVILFLAVDLPTGATASASPGTSYKSYRYNIRTLNDASMGGVISAFVKGPRVKVQPNHVFIMGDFNYDVVIEAADIDKELANSPSQQTVASLYGKDELKAAINTEGSPLQGFIEGVAGNGPEFMPTWKLKRGRPVTCQRSRVKECYEFTGPFTSIGWHDRIIYKSINAVGKIDCLQYTDFDIESINESTHAGVTGLYKIK